MATTGNPFNKTNLDRYKQLFLPPKRKGFPTAGLLEAERSGLASFLGATDYDKQLKESQDLAKLQLALSVAQRGFAGMGATPKRGQSGFGALASNVFAPIAGDFGAIAPQLIRQKQAVQAAKRAEDRQLKLAALQNVQRRQDQEYAADLAATDSARKFMLMVGKRDATPSTDYTVDGKPAPIMIEKDWDGKFRYKDSDGKEISKKRLGVYKKGVKGFKSNVTKASDIELLVKDTDGKETWRLIDATVTTDFGPDGRPSTVVMRETTSGKPLFLTGKKRNARKAPKPGSKTSAYFGPKSDTVYLTKGAVEAFNLPKHMLGKQATATTFTPKPDVGKGLPLFSTLRVAGKTFDMRDHTGWHSATGTIRKELPSGIVTYAPEDLWQETKPGEGVDTKDVYGQYFKPDGSISEVVPVVMRTTPLLGGGIQKRYFTDIEGVTTEIPGGGFTLHDEKNKPYKKAATVLRVSGENLEALQGIKGFKGAKPNEIVEVWVSDPVGGKAGSQKKQYRYKGATVAIPEAVVDSSLRAGALTEVGKLRAGQTVRPTVAAPDMYVGTKDDAAALQKLGVYINAGESVAVFRSAGDSAAGVDDTFTYMYQGEEIPAEALDYLQTTPLTKDQLEAAGLETGELIRYENVGDSPITIKGTPVAVREGVQLTNLELSKLPSKIQNALRKTGTAPEAASYIVTKEGKVGDRSLTPGNQVFLTQAQYDKLSHEEKRLLTTDPTVKGDAIRKHYLKSLWNTVRKTEVTAADKPGKLTDEILNSLLAQFPSTSRAARNEIVPRMLQLMGVGPPAKDEGLVKAKSTAAAADDTYIKGLNDRMKKAGETYEKLRAKGAIADIPWEDQPYAKRRAFLDLPTARLTVAKAQGQLEASSKKLSEDKKSYKHPSAEDEAGFTTKIRLVAVLQEMLEDRDLKKYTGVLGGWISGLRAGLSDLPAVGDKGAGRFKSTLQQLGANLKNLQTEEGRPSNYRIQLVEKLLPKFNQAELINEKNVKHALSVLKQDIKSYFDPQGHAATAVVPPSFMDMAAEVDIIVDPKVRQSLMKRYRWLDPNVKAELPFTDADFQEVIGRAPFTREDFKGYIVGWRLPRRLNPKKAPNSIWLKVDDTRVIQSRDGKNPAPGAKPQTIIFPE